jgi:hypothetical protein
MTWRSDFPKGQRLFPRAFRAMLNPSKRTLLFWREEAAADIFFHSFAGRGTKHAQWHRIKLFSSDYLDDNNQ